MSEIKVPLYNMTGSEVGKQVLPVRLFGVVVGIGVGVGVGMAGVATHPAPNRSVAAIAMANVPKVFFI
jgi:hypothetical protein